MSTAAVISQNSKRHLFNRVIARVRKGGKKDYSAASNAPVPSTSSHARTALGIPIDKTSGKPKTAPRSSALKERALATPKKKAPLPEPTRSEQMYTLLRDGNYECLICSDEIEPGAPLWSCRQCHHAYHTTCATAWAEQSPSKPDFDPNYTHSWPCPTCKTNSLALPTSTCWCGKTPFENITGEANSCNEPCLTLSECKGRMKCLGFCDRPCHPGPCDSVRCSKECRDFKMLEEEMSRVRAAGGREKERLLKKKDEAKKVQRKLLTDEKEMKIRLGRVGLRVRSDPVALAAAEAAASRAQRDSAVARVAARLARPIWASRPADRILRGEWMHREVGGTWG